jgi:two-component system chemotaxis response regulator CheY
VLATGNLLLPFWLIDLRCVSGYLRVISPHQRKPLARKILLADDSVTAQNMGRKILADAGYEVITVNNGSAALKKIAEHKPDLIVLDVYMPGYSGLEVCQRLKEAQETARIPVLLTVGKLEPFKPEEARRVRAEGFIVKPFEASELLSALAKLEDKVVPRAEASKPGRFARAFAAVEEASRGEAEAAADADTGWKNRIGFPSKKKKNEVEGNGDDSAINNTVNRDRRTVVEQESAQPAGPAAEASRKEAAKPEASRVDVAALAPEGLPKDVTPEEIAAIAAAAAQVQATVMAAREASEAEAQAELKQQAKPEASPASPEIKSPEPTAEPVAGATFAERKAEQEIETKTASGHGKEPEIPSQPSAAEVVAAIAAMEPAIGKGWGEGSGNGSSHHSGGRSSEEPASIPATMAVATSAAAASTGPRWTAVPVAIGADEAAISLEQEMQKAHAAFAAAEANSPGFLTSFPRVEVPHAGAALTEPAQTLSAVAHVSTDISSEAVAAAATVLAEVAASLADAKSPVAGDANPAPAAHTEERSQLDPASLQMMEAVPQAAAPEPVREVAAEAPPAPQEESVAATEHSAPAAAEEISKEDSKANVHEVEPAAPALAEATVAHGKPAAGRTDDMANKESELAAATAAAWASWHQIRDTGDSKASGSAKSRKHEDDDDEYPESAAESAAMAVAAGAEKSPEGARETSENDPASIASIVDSVLADLRPKIAEEIAKKMKKKK